MLKTTKSAIFALMLLLTSFVMGVDDAISEPGGPTVTFSILAPGISSGFTNAGGVFNIDVTFSEAVTGFDHVNDDIEFTDLAGNEVTGIQAIAIALTGTRTYMVTILVGDRAAHTRLNILETSTGTTSNLKNQPAALFLSHDGSPEPKPVSVNLARVSSDTVSGPFEVTATFSQPVTGFEATDFTVAGHDTTVPPTISGPHFTLQSLHFYTLTITPLTDGTGNITITIAAGVAALSTNPAFMNTAAPETLEVPYDTRPVIGGVRVEGLYNADGDELLTETDGSDFTVIIRFSEGVTGFAKTDIMVSGVDSFGQPLAVDDSDNRDFSVSINPTFGSTDNVVISINARAVTAVASNGGTNAAFSGPLTRVVDVTGPVASLSGLPTDDEGNIRATGPFSVFITITEAAVAKPPSTNLLPVITVTNATVTVTTEGINLFAHIVPTGVGDIVINLVPGGVTDAAGVDNTVITIKSNNNVALPATVPYVGPPVVRLARIPPATDETVVTGVFMITATFSEPVTGFTFANVDTIFKDTLASVEVTAISMPSVLSSGKQVYTLTLRPTQTGMGTITIQVNGGAGKVGDTGNLASDTLPVNYDTRPVLESLTRSDGASTTVTTLEDVEITATFSKPVTGFDMDDIAVTLRNSNNVIVDGTVGVTVAVSDDPNIYTVTLDLPDDLAPDTSITISPSASITVDNLAPVEAGIETVVVYNLPLTVTLAGPATAFGAENIEVTATFSKVLDAAPVAGGFDISEGGGSIGAITLDPDTNGLVYTLEIEPPFNTDTTITVSLRANTVTAAVGGNNEISNELSITYDGTSPEFTVTFSPAGEPTAVSNVPFTVTAIAGEIVNHAGSTFTSSELSRSLNVDFTTGAFSRNGNGRRVDFTLVADGTAHRYPAIRTLPIPVVDGLNDISWQIPAGIVTDVAGNPNIASPSEPFIFTYVAPPTVKFTAPAVVFGTEPFEVQVNFEDASKAPVVVSNFVLADINFVNNNWAQAALTANSDRSSHRLVITPNNGNGDIVFEVQHRLDADTGNITVNGARSSVAAAQMTVRYRDSLNVSLSPAVPASVDSTALFTTTATFQTSGTAVADLAVTGFDANDVVITPHANATVEVRADTSSANVYAIDITPTGLGAFEFSINGEVTVSDIAVPVSTTPTTVAYSPSDTTAPRLVGLRGPNNGSNFQVDTLGVFDLTMTFSEPVQGFDINDLFFSPESIQSLTVSSTDQKVYTLTITPKTNLIPGAVMSITYDSRNNAADIDANNGADIKDLAVIPNPLGILTSDAITTLAATYAPPTTLTLTAPDNTPTSTPPTANGEVRTLEDIVVTATFSADVTGFDQNDINVAVSGVTTPSVPVAPSNIAVTGGPRVYTVTISPASATPVGQVFTITPTLVGVEDEFNNGVLTANANASVVTYAPTTAVLRANVTTKTIDTLYDSYVVTVTFNRAVGFGTGDGFGIDDFNIAEELEPLVAANLVAATSNTYNTVYRLTVTPKSTIDSTVFTLLSVTAFGDDFDVVDEDGFASRGAALASIVTYTPAADTTAPTLVSLEGPSGDVVKTLGDIVVTATFSEDVTGFDDSDIDVDVGGVTAPAVAIAPSSIAVTGGPSVYTVTITPNDNTPVDQTFTISVSADDSGITDTSVSVNDLADVSIAAVTVTYTPAPDTTPPRLLSMAVPDTFSLTDGSLNFDVTVTFSEPVTGFDRPDLEVLLDGTVVTTVLLVVRRKEGEPTTGPASVYIVEVLPPGSVSVGTVLTIQPSSSLTTTVKDIGNNLVVNPDDVKAVSTYMPPDTTAPTLVSLEGPSGDVVEALADIVVTATFSEDVTGFDFNDIDVAVGGVTAPAVALAPSSITVTPVDSRADAYTVTITPNDNTPVGQTFTISVSADSGITDTSVNENALAAVSIAAVTVTYMPPDTTAPTLVSLDGPSGDVVTTVAADFEITATFSEPVTGFDEDTVAISLSLDGVGNPVAIPDGGISVSTTDDNPATDNIVYTVTITPDITTPSGQTFAISVTNISAIKDLSDAENALAAVSIAAVTVTYTPAADTTPPTLVSLDGPSGDVVKTLGDIVVTATFSEDVTGFDDSDIDVDVGGVTAPAVAIAPRSIAVTGGPSVYTVTITPNDNTPVDQTFTISVGNDRGITDTSVNENALATVSIAAVTVTYDPPRLVSMVVPDTFSTLANFDVTVTFSEPVTGFDTFDLEVLSTTPNTVNWVVSPTTGFHSTYRVTLQPPSGLPVGTVVTLQPLSFLTTTVRNSADNLVVNPDDVKAVSTYTPADTTPPTLNSLVGPSGGVVETLADIEITATFSEDVTGFDFNDIDVAVGGVTAPAVALAPSSITVTPVDSRADAYTVTITPNDNTPVGQTFTISVSADDSGITDTSVSVNALADVSIAAVTVTYMPPDTTAPTLVSLEGPSGDVVTTVAAAFEITATFSEPVTGFDQLDIAISVGGVTAPAAPLLATNIAVTDGPNSVYTVTITPDLATPAGQTFTISVRDSSGITDTSVNVNALEAAGSIAAVVTYTPVVDTTPPTVESIVAFRTDATTGGTNTLVAKNVPSFDIRVTFSESVNGFDATDLTFSPSLPAGNSISVSTTDKIVHTATITPASSVTTSTSYIININRGVTGIKDLADIALTPNTLAGVTVIHTPPAPITVTLSGFPTTPINSQTAFDVTAQFSADVTGFEAGHVTITPTTGDTSRILASVIVTGTGSTYNLAITPLLEGTFTIAIAEMAIMNNVASTPEVSITYDGTSPTVTLRDFPAAVSNVKFTGVVDFDEDVSNGDDRFKSAGLSGMNANVIPGGIRQSGTNYTLTLLADGVGPVMLNVPENVAADAAGNFNVAARALNDPLIIPYIAPPTATWQVLAARTDRTPFTITVTFSSAVTDFDAADVTTTNTETLTDAHISQAGNVYTLTVTPDVDGDITITIPGNTDSNGIAEGNVSVDGVLTNVVSDVRTVTYTPPEPLTVELSTRTQFLTDTADSAVVTATFSEPIVELSTGHTESQANARKLQFLTSDPTDTKRPQTAVFSTFEMKNSRVYELTLVINSSSPAGDVYVRFGAGRATSAADSSKMNLRDSNQLRIRVAAADGVDPTLQSLVGPDVVDSLGSFKVTATFSEPVENFDEDDITVSTAVPNGVAVPAASVAVSTTDDNPVTDDIVYTVTITPATNTPPGQTFTISATGASGVQDLSNNNLETVLSSVGETTVTYDPPPTLVSLSAASVVSSLGAFDVTVTFSEDVDGFDANDIAVTVSDVTAPVDPSSIAVAPATATTTGFATVYTVTIMPASTTPSGQRFTISATGASGVQDSTDNDLAPVSDSVGQETVTYTPLTPPAAPTVTLSGFPTTPIKSQTAFDVTAQFSADVTGFEAGHVTITPDASASVVVTGTGRTYNLAITPLLEGTFTIAIEGMAIMNNVASTPEVSVTFDETLPILQLSGGLNNSQTSFAVATLGQFEVTADFMEPVIGFKARHITASTGSVISVVPVPNTEEPAGASSRYTVTIEPPDDWVAGPTGAITIGSSDPFNGVEDLAKNIAIGVFFPAVVTYDPPPTLVSLSAPSVVSTLGAFDVTVTFSKEVDGFDATDITVTVSDVTAPVDPSSIAVAPATATTTGFATVYTVTIMPASTTPSGQRFTISATGTSGVQDLANNDLEDVSDLVGQTTVTYTPPTPPAAPTVTLSGFPTTPINSRATFDVTAQFSADVTGFEAGHVTITPDANASVVVTGTGSTYNLAITPLLQGTFTIAIAEMAIMNNVASTPEVSVTFDETRPVLQLRGGVDNLQNRFAVTTSGRFEVAAVFTEPVTGFETGHITVSSGSVISVEPVPITGEPAGANSRYTVTIEPPDDWVAGPTGAITVGTGAANSSLTDVEDLAKNIAIGVFFPAVVTYDPPPTLVSLSAASVVSTLGAFDVTVTFSKEVDGFDATDITVTVSDVTAPVDPSSIAVAPATATTTGFATVYTVTIMPASTTPSGQRFTISATGASGVQDLTDNDLEDVSDLVGQTTVTYTPPDTTAPPVTLTLSSGPTSAVVTDLNSFEITATFSALVTGFDEDDVSVTVGGVTTTVDPSVDVRTTDDNPVTNNIVYTVTITPAANTPVGQTFALVVTLEGVEDDAMNAVTSTQSSEVVTYMPTPDGTLPTLDSVDGPDGISTDVYNLNPFDITVTFSEPVTGFTEDDVSYSPSSDTATMVAPTSVVVTPDEGVSVYTVTVTPADNTPSGQVFTIFLLSISGVEDLSNNPLGTVVSSAPTVIYTDNTDPTLDSLVGPDGNANFSVTTREFQMTATFSEDVTGIDEADFSATSPSITVDSVITVEPATGPASVYTVTITLPETTPSGQVYTIFANNLVGEDLAGNAVPTPGFASIVTFTPAPPPTATLTGPAELIGRANFEVTVTFDEGVSFDTTLVDVAGGTYTSEGTVTVTATGAHTLTIMPNAGTDPVTVTLLAGAFTSTASDTANAVASGTHTANPDNTDPTLESVLGPTGRIVAMVNNLNNFDITVTFSEPVTGFDVNDVSVAPSTLATRVVTPTEGASVYTVTVTPDPATPSDQTFTILTSLSGVEDLAGNSVTPVTPSAPTVTYTPVTPPTAMLTGPAELIGRANFEVTVTFDEEVSFDTTLVDVAGGTYTSEGTVTVTGTTFTHPLTIMPAADTTDPVTVTLLAGAFTSTESNTANAVASDTHKADPDITRPTLDSLVGPSGGDVDSLVESFEVTVTFSEPVADFDEDDITVSTAVPNGVAVPADNVVVASTEGGRVYTVTITPALTTPVGQTFTIDVNEIMDVQDFANNGLEAVSSTISETTVTYVDTTPAPPTATLTGPAELIGRANFEVTVTFDEEVSFDTTLVDVAGGTYTSEGTVIVAATGAHTLTIMPAADTTDPVTVTLLAGAFTSTASMTANAVASDTHKADPDMTAPSIDTTDPSVMLTGAPDTATSRAPFTVTATFTEAVSGFEASDISVTNVAATRVTGRGANYVLTITPNGNGDIEITIPKDVAVDGADNGNTASELVSVTYDAAAPTVTLAGPDTLSNLEPFAVTLTFSEDVTGLEMPDIEVINGVVTTFSGSGANYVLTLTPTGSGDLLVTIPAAVAVDAVANGNTAGALAVVSTIVADTKAAIAGFMLDRANNLARNQPGLTRFLQGTGCGSVSTSLSGNNASTSGSVGGCVSRGQAWGEFSSAWSSDSFYTLATLGTHKFVRDDFIIGGMVQFDAGDNDARNITGRGWLAGPYFVSKPADQDMLFEGRLLYGQTDNDISPLGSYRDSFDTDRYLAQLRVTGQYGYRTATLMPLLDLTYLEDTQQDYTDTLNNLLDEQGIDLTQVTFGLDFKLPVIIAKGQLDLTGGLSGTYSEVNGGESNVEGGRGRLELGLNYVSDNGVTLAGGIFYDGISSDHESYGVNLSLDMKF